MYTKSQQQPHQMLGFQQRFYQWQRVWCCDCLRSELAESLSGWLQSLCTGWTVSLCSPELLRHPEPIPEGDSKDRGDMIKLINTINSWTVVEKSVLSLAGIMLRGKIKQPSQRCQLNIWIGLYLSYHSYTVLLYATVQKAYRSLFVYVILCAFHNYLLGAQRSQRHIHYMWANTKYTLFILTPSIHDLSHVGYEALKMHLDLTLAK